MSRNLQDVIRREIHSLHHPSIPDGAVLKAVRGIKQSSFTSATTLITYSASLVRAIVRVQIAAGLNADSIATVRVADNSYKWEAIAANTAPANVDFEQYRDPIILTDNLEFLVTTGAPSQTSFIVNAWYFEYDA
jgi:hypothetical protein